MYTVRERTLIVLKWLASFSRSEWRLCDYPVRARPNGVGAMPSQEWIAQILNWPGPGGTGVSKEGAITNLGENLEGIRAHRRANGQKMPRPGSRVPVEFAPTDRVLADPALHDDFIIRILGFAPGSPVFISDQSSLSDFGDESYVATLRTKIADVYGIDVSDLKGGLLCEILERIGSNR